MFGMQIKQKNLVLAIGLVILVGVTEKVEAVCDIEKVCEHVEVEKKGQKLSLEDTETKPDNKETTTEDTELTPEEKEPTLDQGTIRKIKEKCEKSDVLGSICPMTQVIKLCWDRKSVALVVDQCVKH